ncbi:MAG TPA: glycosyltransferase [Gemmatimonadaceae bacterium]
MHDRGGATPHLSVVIPVYNGVRRLRANLAAVEQFLVAQPYASELVLVDDGSAEPAARVLREFAADKPAVLLVRNDPNRGKGFSVGRGMLAAHGRYRVFTDADLAFPPDQINRILCTLDGGADVAIACRVLPESRYTMSPEFFHYLYTRHLLSRTFNLMVRRLMLRDVRDTQAGLKGFTARAAELVFPRLAVPRFGFDVEALYVAQKHGLTVHQTAVDFRYENEPSTVSFVKAGFTMAGDLVRVKLNDWRGRYA